VVAAPPESTSTRLVDRATAKWRALPTYATAAPVTPAENGSPERIVVAVPVVASTRWMSPASRTRKISPVCESRVMA
jgi:hypothetical protein